MPTIAQLSVTRSLALPMLLLLPLMVTGLTACGQQGPLYLPDQASPAVLKQHERETYTFGNSKHPELKKAGLNKQEAKGEAESLSSARPAAATATSARDEEDKP